MVHVRWRKRGVRSRSRDRARVVMSWALGAVTVGVVALGNGQSAAACECAVIPDDQRIANADAIFTGRLIDVITPSEMADPARFVFAVDEVFKGDVFAQQSIVTASSGASCGLEISGPGPFVVFARAESDGITAGAVKGEFYSGLCSGTGPLASGVLPANFGLGSPPRPGTSPIENNGGPPNGSGRMSPAIWIAIAAGVVVAVTVGGLAARGRSRSVTSMQHAAGRRPDSEHY